MSWQFMSYVYVCRFELCLSWDPVACLVHDIKSALISLRPDPVTCTGVANGAEVEELFVMSDLKELLPGKLHTDVCTVTLYKDHKIRYTCTCSACM